MDKWTFLMWTNTYHKKSCFDKLTHTMYTLDYEARDLHKANVLSKELKRISGIKTQSLTAEDEMVFLNGAIHLVLRNGSKLIHYEIDLTKDTDIKGKQIHSFDVPPSDPWRVLHFDKLIAVPSRNMIILFDPAFIMYTYSTITEK